MKKATLTENKAEQTPTGGVLVGKRQGQTIIHNKGTLSGYLVGKTHAEGGIKAVNKSTGQPLEMQGGEVVITAPAVSDNTKNEFNGKMMTNREILSQINVNGGGVSFAKGGDIPKNIKRTGAKYKYGGKTMTDHEIYKHITKRQTASLVRNTKIANAQTRDLNNASDVLDINADGVYGADTGLFADGGSVEENFKKWFDGSKVIDIKGKPLVVYHGSPDLRGLNSEYVFKTTDERYGISNENRAYFFTDSYGIAKSYADPKRAFDYQNAEEGIVSLYLSLKNPLIVNAYNEIWRKFETEINGEKIVGTRNLISYAQSKNYDGVIVKNVRDYHTDNENKKSGGNVYVAFKPTQIKLADGTNTTFDSENDDIRYDNGGLLKEVDKKEKSFESEGSTEGKGKLYEFFTPQIIADKMLALAQHYGFKGGNVLEPATGSGRLIKNLKYTNITAFEISKDNFEILKREFPNAELYNFNFEKAFLKEPRFNTLLNRKGTETWLKGAPFDLVVSNPPYGKFSGLYSSYFNFKGQVEHFFILQTLYLLKKGGLGVYLIPSSFLRNGIAYNDIKKQIFEIAELVDAYRLPSNIFEKTQIGTDILILRKK